MIWSVSTFARSSGATRPSRRVNFSIFSSAPLPHVDEMAGDRGRRGHRRADDVRAAAFALASVQIAIGGPGAPLARIEPLGIHAEAQRAAAPAPLQAHGAAH